MVAQQISELGTFQNAGKGGRSKIAGITRSLAAGGRYQDACLVHMRMGSEIQAC